MSDDVSGGPETWIGRATAITEAAALLLAGESVDIQRHVLADLIARWRRQFAPPTSLTASIPISRPVTPPCRELLDSYAGLRGSSRSAQWMRSAQ